MDRPRAQRPHRAVHDLRRRHQAAAARCRHPDHGAARLASRSQCLAHARHHRTGLDRALCGATHLGAWRHPAHRLPRWRHRDAYTYRQPAVFAHTVRRLSRLHLVGWPFPAQPQDAIADPVQPIGTKEKKMLTAIVILLVLIAALLIYAATKPDNFTVSRSASIKAPPETIFPLIDDFRRWTVWSPYKKLDPDMKRTLSGAESGKGATYAWEGNSKAGIGRMEITNSMPSSLVAKARFRKAIQGQQHRRLHAEADRQRNRRHLGDARALPLHRQADRRLHQHGQDGRQGFRNRPRQSQAGHRTARCPASRKRLKAVLLPQRMCLKTQRLCAPRWTRKA
ncbi:hypothetical protein BQ8482_20146 [Mesorhizobium delmotii]|uniref:Polyketide cyclase n=1 Tax=Mesorhizobium delmotii TaxID=1631247 RepID=A0A2P9AK59_9HYPH|nr:hypothetical protein BQ8482_20146 [Mesorhizobium delmotii]